MNITLSKNSWHFKIYSMVFSDRTPKSLCPYFWSWVGMVIVSPILVLIGLMKFLSKVFESKPVSKKSINDMTDEEITKKYQEVLKKEKRAELTAKIFLGFWVFVCFALIIFTAYLQINKDGWFDFFRFVFSLIGVCTTLYWIIRLVAHYSEKIGNSNVIKVPVAIIKSVYTKTCPIINWK